MEEFKLNPIAPPRQAEVGPSVLETVEAAFGQESGFVALARAAQQRTFKSDPEWSHEDFYSRRPDLLPFQSVFKNAESEAEAVDMEKRMRAEEKRRAQLQASGMTGIVASIGAGVFSPSTFVPFAGPIRGLRGVAAVATGAVASAALDESILQATQITRTAEETTSNLIGTAILGAALGGAVQMFLPKEFNAALKAMEDPQELRVGFDAPLALDRSIGAAEVRPRALENRNLEGVLSPNELAEAGLGAKVLNRLMRTSGLGSTVGRNLMNLYPEVRGIQARLADGGLRFRSEGDALNPSAAGGTVETRSRLQINNYTIKGLDILEDNYTQYYYKKPQVTRAQRARAEIGGVVSRGGRLSRKQFDRAVFVEAQTPMPGAVPEVQAAAKRLRDEFYNPIFEELKKVGLLPKELAEGDTAAAMGYITHVYDKNSVMRSPQQFVDMIVRAYQQNMSDRYARKLERVKTADTRAQEDIQDLSLPDEEISDVQREIQEERELFAKSNVADTRERMASLRREMRFYQTNEKVQGIIGPGTNPATPVFPVMKRMKEIERELEQLDATLSPADKEAITRDNRLRRRSQLLSQAVARLTSRQGKALGAIEVHEERAVRILRTITNKAHEFMTTMPQLSDEAYAKGLSALRNDFSTALAQVEKLDARISDIEKRNPEFQTGPASLELRVKSETMAGKILPAGKTVLEDEADRAWALGKIDESLADPAALDWSPQQLRSVNKLREKIAQAPLKSRTELQSAFDEVVGLNDARDSLTKKMDETLELLEQASKEGPEYAREVLTEWYDDALRGLSDRMQNMGVRRERLRQRAVSLSPQRAHDRIAGLKLRMEQRNEGLDSWIGEKGGSKDGDVIDWTDGGKELAQYMRDKIIGDPQGVPGMAAIAERGAEIARVLDIPLADKIQFLETDMDKLVRIYARNMVPDVELVRAGFGVNGSKAIEEVTKLYEKLSSKVDSGTAEQLPKRLNRKTGEDDAAFSARETQALEAWKNEERARLAKEELAVKESIVGQVQRLRHQRAIPDDPDSYLYRGGRMLLQWNTVTMMGNVLVSSLVDPVLAVGRYGLRRTFRHGVKPLVTNLRAMKMSMREAKYAGMNELMLQDRFYQLTELMDDATGNRTMPEKAADFLANKIGTVGLFSYWTQAMKSWATPIAVGRIMDAMEVYKTGKPAHGMTVKKAVDALAYAQLDDALVDRIWAQTGKGGFSKVNDLWVPNTEAWDDPVARDAFRAAILSDVEMAVVTPGVERPLFTDASLGHKLLFQFQSFMWSSHTKVVMAGLQQRDAAAMSGVLMGFGMAALAYWADMTARGKDTSDDPNVWIDEMIMRSPYLGVMAQGLKVGQAMPATRPYLQFSDEGPSRGFAVQGLAGATLGPSYSTYNKLMKIAAEFDDPTQSTVHTVRSLAPYNNVFWARQMFDYIEDNAGFPERRQPN